MSADVLQRVAVSAAGRVLLAGCSVLQCVAVSCSVLQCVAACCSVGVAYQITATHYCVCNCCRFRL